MEFLTLSLTQTEPPAVCRLQFIFLPRTGSLYLLGYLSNFEDSSLPCDLNSLMGLKRVVDFQFSSAFYLLRKSDDLQIHYMLYWKLEASLLLSGEILVLLHLIIYMVECKFTVLLFVFYMCFILFVLFPSIFCSRFDYLLMPSFIPMSPY